VLLGPTALPIRDDAGHYVARHGPGYSRFEHAAHGLGLELLQYVPLDDPIKISRLRIEDRSGRARRLSVTAYVEWVLGASRSAGAPFVTTSIDADTGALLARNPWRTAFGDRVAFADLAGRQLAWSGDRTEFLGRNGTLERPAALQSEKPLSGRVGAGLDPCGALQTWLELEPHGAAEIVFFLGEATSREEALALVTRYRRTDLDAVLASVARHWDDVLGVVQVRTPDRSFDLLLNRWLLYQTLACRIRARSAFYQASGAYGFRDQLQDGMALALAKPELVREHLLRAAGRQFVAGDVQHWWLPHSGQGVRTRIADDLVWLAYATSHYVRTTGDREVLDEQIPFLDGPALREGEHDSFFQPMPADEHGTLFEHCARALDRSLAVGVHGLPLFGTGDWNDGMNRVGEQGKGESVWLGWFLHATLTGFAPLAEARGEATRPPAGAPTPRASRRPSSDPRGTATGTGAAGSTTARRSGRPRAASVASTPSRSRGRCSPAPPIRTARAGPWRPWTSTWSAATTGSCCSSRRPSIARRSTPATSRGTRRACARTAGSTPTPPSGRCWRSPSWATGTPRRSCSRC
jgi:cyclic beta-1,2-glucan synthetase